MWATSIGRTAQTHEYHMLHEAAWPFGVFAWQRILCQWNQSTLHDLEPDPHDSSVHPSCHGLIPACPGPTGTLARPFGLELEVTVEVHIIGHSAGSYAAMVLAAVLPFRRLKEAPRLLLLQCQALY